MRGAGAIPLAAAAICLAGYRGHYLPRASALDVPAPSGASTVDVCESRTINYITHTLPQLCLKTSWSSANSSAAIRDAPAAATPGEGRPEPTAANLTDPEQKKQAAPAAADRDDAQDLATSSFMSFEEWKALQLKKAGQDVADLQARKRQERDPSAGHDLDSLGDEGEIDLNFDVLSEKVSEMASPPSASSLDAAAVQKGEGGKKDEAVLYDDGTTRYYRSKDAGRTCKERFSYSSFDGGATILKNSKGAKNAKAILVENKDSYMLLECGTDNKFVIVELSEDILVDTVVLANFEFFSSMIRHFRVGVSDRWPVKMDKWKDLGTFEARNSRDIQAFLIEHPQIWAKYIRIEFLSHYGNEFYCPVSLLRVHGTRMLDSWKETEAGGDDDEETIDAGPAEPVAPAVEGDAAAAATASAAQANVSEPGAVGEVEYDSEVSLSPWHPFYYMEGVNNTCWTFASPVVGPSPAPSAPSRRGDEAAGPATDSEYGPAADQASVAAPSGGDSAQAPAPSAISAPASEPIPSTSASTANAAGGGAGTPASPIPQTTTTTTDTAPTRSGEAASPSQPNSVVKAPASEPSLAPPSPPSAVKQASSKAPPPPPSGGGKPPPTATTTTTTVIPKSSTPPSQAKNRTAPAGNPVASPTVQESFFKSVTKRLQFLESNTSLSLQYIEDQSRFLQEALGKMERKQMARVDSFLDTLNNTVLSELRNVRTQYDQIWQSTVIALESQREQSQREVAALGDRLNVLADEVVFQKRMAILQSVLLLACLVLVIFSRGIVGATPTITFDGPSASSLLSSPSLSGTLLRSDSTAYATDSPSPSPLRRSGVVNRAAAAAGRPPAMPRSQSYPDKVLPLTPTSDYSRDDASPPPLAPPLPPPVAADGSAADDPSQSSSSYYADEDETEEPGATFTPANSRLRPGSRQETPSQQGNDAASTAARASLLPSPLPSRDGSVEHVVSAETALGPSTLGTVAAPEANYSSDGMDTARSLLSHTSMGSMRKPLPALPEDPS